jgi:phospholipid/cholesterol/gamma-HCH transport system substrate-binding protein
VIRRAIATAALVAIASSGLAACSTGTGGGGYAVTAYFPKAISLYNSSSVKVLGLPAGKVTSVKVIGTRVRVKMRINDSVPLPADVNAALVPLSLIGERYVQLFPAWVHGQARLPGGSVIPEARTSIPVEPDEALAAVKHLLDALDPQATGRLVKNLGDDLQGTGADINGALKGIADVTTSFAAKDDDLVAIIDHFDQFTSTLRTREAALGKVLDGFADTTSLLADERQAIQDLVKNLASVSTTGLDLTSEHAAKLDRDLTILTRVLQSAKQNIGGVRNLLDAAPLLVAGPNLDGTRGLAGAWNPETHALDLRDAASPDAAQLFQALGIPINILCLPIDVNCVVPPSAGAAKPAAVVAPATTVPPARPIVTTPPKKSESWLRRTARSLASVFS